MLRYKLNNTFETKLKYFDFSELYVSPDLSYISGVTPYSTELVDGERVAVKTKYTGKASDVLTISSQKVRRQGRVLIEKTLEVKEISKIVTLPVSYDYNTNEYYYVKNNQRITEGIDPEKEYITEEITQKYVENNGEISYLFSKDGINGFLIDNVFYSYNDGDSTISIKTYYWIEDGHLVVDGVDCLADMSLIERGDGTYAEPTIRLNKSLSPIYRNSTIIDTSCKILGIFDYEPNKWEYVYKFVIYKKPDETLDIESVSCGGYRHYIRYANETYYLDDAYRLTYNEDGEEEKEYIGYGVDIDGKFYSGLTNYGSDELFGEHRDLSSDGGSVYIDEAEELCDMHDVIVAQQSGRFLLIFLPYDAAPNVGTTIMVRSNQSVNSRLYLSTDDNGNDYVDYLGVRYYSEANMFDTVNIANEDYRLEYNEDKTNATIETVNGSSMKFNTNNGNASTSYKIYVKNGENSINEPVISFKNEEYVISQNDGIIINNVAYKVINEPYTDSSGEDYYYKYIEINGEVEYKLTVDDVNGSSMLVCSLALDEGKYDVFQEDAILRDLCTDIALNYQNYSFYIPDDIFGDKAITVENYLLESMDTWKPYAISGKDLLGSSVQLMKIEDYLSFKLPFTTNVANNINREKILTHDLVQQVKNEYINDIVDMEKDVYSPFISKDNSLIRADEIRFNFHFRNRDLDSWKVIEDGGWFVTDYDFYKNNQADLQNVSDLLGFVNFSNSEVKNMAKKISKTFIRLSFYSTPNPSTQVLLATSTIHLDEAALAKKLMDYNKTSKFTFKDVKTNVDGLSSVTVNTEAITGEGNLFEDSHRISSRIVTTDKFTTKTTSEGYYLYLFKEYSNRMRTSTIYLRVDFCHAGIGKTIPMTLPREINDNNVRVLTIKNDKEKLLEGITIKDIYKQTFIPVNIVFDDKLNKYVYYLPPYLNSNEDGVIEFNLFEPKFKDESN